MTEDNKIKDPALFYKKRIEEFKSLEISCIKKEKWFSFIRLFLFITAIVLFYFIFKTNKLIAFISLFVFIIGFLYVVKLDLANFSKKQFYIIMHTLNENEYKSLKGKSDFFFEGGEYQEKEHNYSSDLDIFGKFSLFQFVNRSNLKVSRDILASWLKLPALPEEIYLRQKAIEELSSKPDWIQRLFSVSFKIKEINNNQQQIVDWIKEPCLFIANKFLKIIIYVLPIITLVSIVLSFYFLPTVVPSMIFLLNLSIIAARIKQINIIHSKLSSNTALLKSCAKIITIIEKENFQADKLKFLKEFFSKSISSFEINNLSKLMNKFDYRNNIIVGFLLNALFLWDIRVVLKLEKWKIKNNNIDDLFTTIGQVEALASMANLKFNYPNWTFPKISNNYFNFKAKMLGHPLIAEERMIRNDFGILGARKIILVTGSNMSGKSTFLRTIGINMVLAMAGSCVCATEFEMSPVKIMTSMRINDSLEENTSSFYAELKRLENIIKTVSSKEKVFLLLDEILRGTNSNDRHIGSIALIKQLITENAVGIIATHDLELSKLGAEMPANIDNYNFDVKVENDELYFDYKLNNGICSSLNASILMKKIGISI